MISLAQGKFFSPSKQPPHYISWCLKYLQNRQKLFPLSPKMQILNQEVPQCREFCLWRGRYLSQVGREGRTWRTARTEKREGGNIDVLLTSQRCLELTLEHFPFVLTQERSWGKTLFSKALCLVPMVSNSQG